jgi:DNA-binding MarR family transcriptional regulator
MSQEQQIIQKLYETVNLLVCEIRTARFYGTDFQLSYSDLSFLKCVERNEGVRASEISGFLGMTKGAVAQQSKKLQESKLLTMYRIEGNKKEVYYRLTEQGKLACDNFNQFTETMNKPIREYLSGLDESTRNDVEGLFDHILTEIAKGKECYIKCLCEEPTDLDAEGRCEKCKRIF